MDMRLSLNQPLESHGPYRYAKYFCNCYQTSTQSIKVARPSWIGAAGRRRSKLREEDGSSRRGVRMHFFYLDHFNDLPNHAAALQGIDTQINGTPDLSRSPDLDNETR